MTATNSPSPLKAAIAETIRTIERRTRLYRNVIICVCGLSLGCVAGALGMRNYWPLAGVTLLVPLVALYLMLDHRCVYSWRSGILEQSKRGNLDLDKFVKSVSSYGFLPRATLQDMLASLDSQ